jgi:pSer/pThr/pTyr-binding forkhead associated (FHA) protein
MGDCTNCGAPLKGSESLCPSCGAPTSGATASFEPLTDADVADAPVTASAEGPVLVVRKGPQPGERFFIDRAELVVGRDPEADIFLNDMTVSRSHAVLEARGGEVSVRDVGSLNGTYVNGECVDRAVLGEGDVVQIGTFQMVYHVGGES